MSFKNKQIIAVLFFVSFVLLALFLGWANHKDFEKSMLVEEKEELLILAKTQIESLVKQTIDFRQEEKFVRGLIENIDKKAKVYVLICDSRGEIVISPQRSLAGKNVFTITKNIPDARKNRETKIELLKMISGKEGTSTFDFFKEDNANSLTKMIVAFAPMRVQGGLWSLAIFKEFESLSGPLQKNMQDNLLSFFLVLIGFSVWGIILLRMQKKRTELDTAATALKIINKQLHLQIEEERRLEKDIRESLFGSQPPLKRPKR